ncbi:hypothetical protein OO306_10205 [Pseudomonas sp. DCB_AW]|uniref:hypothetical protein n=1 Tax=Pseudomonas sp. DCB_AW TaxID=2993596 RepID=UPI002248A466|nr:hypothetical protein [Pseudomonas sp. DCB_AW]MCX2685914.1 hypothetical protein [Pseudomonas sp. DCB_AW]
MLTHRQRSFIATVEAVDGSLNFLDELLGKPAEFMTPSTYLPARRTNISLPRFAPHYVDLPAEVIPGKKKIKSNYWGHSPDTIDVAPLQLYFRCVDEGYRLFVRSSVRYKHALYLHDENCVCALTSPFNGVYPTPFDLLDTNNAPLAFGDLDDQATVRLTPAGERAPLMLQTFKDNPFTYVSTQGQQPLELRLNILERNAAYLNDPDEV